MTLAAQIVADSTGVFENTSDFAETITYFPKSGGAALAIPAICEETVSPGEDGENLYNRPVLVVEVAMDPAGVNGLPSAPRRGDTLWRSGNGDPSNLRYAFMGRVLGSAGNMWELEFERIELVQAGTIKSL